MPKKSNGDGRSMSLEFISANHAAALAVTLAGRANRSARGFGGGAYPITPQSECIEFLCKQKIEKGHIVTVESEHSAMAACIGFSFGGARSFTASSSNGLAYMTENVFTAALYRLPIVMMAVNRTLGPPWNIWVDHGDTLMLRDAGWIQFYCEDNQEVFDTVLASFRIAEDHRILLPAMICQDAFVLSHTMMLTEIAEQSAVDAFLPPLNLPHRLTLQPRTAGGLDSPHINEVHRYEMAEAMQKVFLAYQECQTDFQKIFGRPLADPIIPYRIEDAEIILVSMGTMASTICKTIEHLREQGIKAGALRVRMFRPWPEKHLRTYLAKAKKLGVLDRNLCPGLGGILWAELRALAPHNCVVQNYLTGLGGGDVRPEHIMKIISDLQVRNQAEDPKLMETG
ncbi:pyruvate ferredoxin oxidoreductase [Candidatus Nomurabacteria bacterium]|nr:pyruvate ferredoxin oxidoreductase [Candidatus Nomurabacteria bacterium]